MRSPFLLIPLAVALASGCSKEPAAPTVDPTANAPASTAMKADSRSHDESSYAEPDKVVVKDIALDLKLDFDSKQIGGTAPTRWSGRTRRPSSWCWTPAS